MESQLNINPENKTKYEESNELRLINSVWAKYALVLLTIAFMSLFVFLSEHNLYYDEAKIETSKWAEFGEFIGGILGTAITFLSVYLLVRTLRVQIQSNIKINENNSQNTQIYLLQQFHDTFSSLIELYHNSVQSLKSDNDEVGKVWLHTKVKDLKAINLLSHIYGEKVKSAVLSYDKFYMLHRECLSVYFRIIYRIIQCVDIASINEAKKAEYSKILRSQLSEDELFLLRYNAMTTNGKKMQVYINRYNLLKHLPIMCLMEFYSLRTKLSIDKINSLDTFFIFYRKKIRDLFLLEELTKVKIFTSETNDKKYKISIKVIRSNSLVRFQLEKQQSKIINSNDSFSIAFDALSDEELENLIEAFLLELFVYSNFSNYHKLDDLNSETKIQSRSDKVKHIVTVKNKSGFPLILSQRQLDRPNQLTIV